MTADTRTRPARAERFTYGDFDVDEQAGVVSCFYNLDGTPYVETVSVGAGQAWSAAAHEAARLVSLLSGVSYYKAGAPPVIDLGKMAVRPGEREFLRRFYVAGLGEFAMRNQVSLIDVQMVGGIDTPSDIDVHLDCDRPLVPFGGGIDSIVTVDAVARAHADVALFIMNRPGDRFAAIEGAAAETGLPVLRAEREIDAAIRRPADPHAVFNGHVPITGVLSAVAVLVAVLDGRGSVVMSNEWSASRGNVVIDGHMINHQWSKSEEFELAFRGLLSGGLGGGLAYFSFLRPFSELWVANRFAELERFHGVFHSCNGAFNLEVSKRNARWCGRCDKCCFIDLILAPFVDESDLAKVFDALEPLADESLLPKFRDLLGIGSGNKPFECVGDVNECRTAATLALDRSDRRRSAVLLHLVDELGEAEATTARSDAARLLRPLGSHAVPDDLFAAATLG